MAQLVDSLIVKVNVADENSALNQVKASISVQQPTLNSTA
jgi:hypothetical protein